MKLKGIVLAVMISLASIMMPFSIYADNFSYVRVTGELMSTTYVKTYQINNQNIEEYLFNYQYKVKFDDSYLGYVQLSITQEFYEDVDNNGNVVSNTQKTYSSPTKTYYVNSDEVVVNLSLRVRLYTGHIQTNYDPCKYFTPSVQYSNANVTKIGLLTSIDQVIDILSDIYTSVDDIEGLSTNQLTELENIVSQTTLSNQYLQTISELRQYNFPIESLCFVSQCYTLNKQKVVDAFYNGYYSYPVFSLNINDTLLSVSTFTYSDSYLIFMSSAYLNLNNFSNAIDIQNGTLINIQQISNLGYRYNNSSLVCYKITFRASGSSNVIFKLVSNLIVIPISFSINGRSNYSTDFALLYGFSNPLLDNIQLIANGTNQSNQAASDLESGNDQMADDMEDLATIENGYNQQFNNQLQSIDFTSPIQNNAGILPAANFVITVFNGLINNNPFSVLIIVVCILLIGKKVIGK